MQPLFILGLSCTLMVLCKIRLSLPVQSGWLAVEKPCFQTERRPQRCGSTTEEEADRNYKLHPRPT